MHATFEELIALRDGGADAAVAAHTEACPSCRAELEGLRTVTAELRALPAQRPAHDAWPGALAALRRERRRRLAARAGIAVAACLALAAGVTWEVLVPRRHAAELAALLQRSQQLELVLDAHARPRVLTAQEAALIADIQDRITVIDARIASRDAAERPVKAAQVRELWRERVALLDELASAQSRPAALVGL